MFPPAVQRGLTLAVEARRRGFLDDRRLQAIFVYYDGEGARGAVEPEAVLRRLGDLTSAQLDDLAGLAREEPVGTPFTDRLTLLDPLGEGAMGAVHRAYDRVLKRLVAVKFIRPERLESDKAAHLLARFQREAQAMARVRHGAVVPIFDAGVDGQGRPYMVMGLIAGSSLKALISATNEAGLEWRQVARWGRELALGLQACHDAGVVHRDVKPANVLIDEQAQPFLTDFGVVKDDNARTKLTAADAAVGTLAYMAPEQAVGGPTDHRVDVYALGATLHEAITGRPLFEHAPNALLLIRQIVETPPPSVSALVRGAPPALDAVLGKALAKSRDDRYASARELAADLQRLLEGQRVEAPAPARPGRLDRRTTTLAVVAGLALLVLGLAIGLAARRSGGVAPAGPVSVARGVALTRQPPPLTAASTVELELLVTDPGREGASVPLVLELVPDGVSAVATRTLPSVRATVGTPATITVRLEPGAQRVRIALRDAASVVTDPVRLWFPGHPERLAPLPLGAGWSFGDEEGDYIASDGRPYRWIPPGSFPMGWNPGGPEEGGVFVSSARPRDVTLTRGFFLAKYETTWREWQSSLSTRDVANPRWERGAEGQGPAFVTGDEFPVTGVLWDEARDFCAHVGGRLPTNAEWERAARGPDGTSPYPWGKDFEGSEPLANLPGDQDGFLYAAPVGRFARDVSGFGCFDMAGNVGEWVDDFQPADVLQENGRRRSWTALDRTEGFTDPRLPPPGSGPLSCGGHHDAGHLATGPEQLRALRKRFARCSNTHFDPPPYQRWAFCGFRVARDPG